MKTSILLLSVAAFLLLTSLPLRTYFPLAVSNAKAPVATGSATPTLSPTPTVSPAATPTRACPDLFEPDDSWTRAKTIAAGAAAQHRNIDKPGDVDYVKFLASAGEYYIVRAFNLGGRPINDTILTLYDTDGTTLLAFSDEHWLEKPGASRIEWRALTSSVYFAKVAQFDPLEGNCRLTYELEVIARTPTPAATLQPRTYFPLFTH